MPAKSKTIRIRSDNRGAIEAALHDSNGAATAHTFTSFEEIERLARVAEKRAIRFAGAQKYIIGAMFNATSGDAVPNAYKYGRRATAVTLIRKRDGWHLAGVDEARVYSDGGKQDLVLPRASFDAGVRYAMSQFRVSLSEAA